jgi:putative PIN family toxin of toxin-antitoxin system
LRVTRAVYDTNVIVSASIARSGLLYEALRVWRRGDIDLVTSEAIVDEVTDVLRRPFFRDDRHVDETDVARARQVLLTDAVVVSPPQRLEVVEADPDDKRILECAVEGGADYIVSGDHHLLDLRLYKGIRIVTVRQFLSILQSDRSG